MGEKTKMQPVAESTASPPSAKPRTNQSALLAAVAEVRETQASLASAQEAMFAAYAESRANQAVIVGILQQILPNISDSLPHPAPTGPTTSSATSTPAVTDPLSLESAIRDVQHSAPRLLSLLLPLSRSPGCLEEQLTPAALDIILPHLVHWCASRECGDGKATRARSTSPYHLATVLLMEAARRSSYTPVLSDARNARDVERASAALSHAASAPFVDTPCCPLANAEVLELAGYLNKCARIQLGTTTSSVTTRRRN